MNANSTGTTLSGQEENYPKSLCKRSLFSRPLPRGGRVHFILLQLILLNITEATAEVYFQAFVVKYYGEELSEAASIPSFISFRSFPLLLCLPMGLIADRYFGRAKVLYYSWVFQFIAQLIFGFYFAILNNHSLPIAGIIIVLVGLLINCCSLAGIRVNLIPFGVDQMRTASSDELSSYFHWYYWCRNLGHFLSYSIGGSFVASTNSFIAFVFSSVAATGGVVINILGYNWFIKREKVGNPLLLVYHVLRYAMAAKRPAERTAFSYDGRPKPSRIDLAKETHYGIFRDEQVEDVKTFLRILVFMVSLFGFLCVYSSLSNVYLTQSTYLKQPNFLENSVIPHCLHKDVTVNYVNKIYSTYWMLLINNVAILLLIPILDRIVYPLCCPWVPSMFSRMAVGMVACVFSIGCAIVVEVFRYNSLQSNFEINDFNDTKIYSATISVGVMAPSFFIQAIAECLTLITMVEFIYAQSPVYMKGLLLGCLFFTEGLAMTLGSLLFLSQSKGTHLYWQYFKVIRDDICDALQSPPNAGSCLSAYVIIIVITFLGTFLFLYSAKHYKIRIRGNALRYFL